MAKACFFFIETASYIMNLHQPQYVSNPKCPRDRQFAKIQIILRITALMATNQAMKVLHELI